VDSVIATCPSCGTKNRIPASREGEPGRCGACRARLPPVYLGPLTLSDSDFDTFVSGYPGPVLAEFWAPW